MELASANTVEEFYTNIITPKFESISKIYKIEKFIANSKNQVFAYRLGDTDARINLPCATNTTELKTPIEINDDFQFEYLLNREIIFGDGRDENEFQKSPFLIQKELLENIYEHFRLSFSNWIATDKNGSNLRDKIRQLIERRDIPSFEKIRRLELELSPKLADWFYPDPNPFSPEPTFIRSDCQAIKDNEERCNGYCTFNNGSCKIHIPQTVQVNEKLTQIDTTRYLLLRLFDEIIRIPARSYELLEKGVKRVQVPSTNIHIKDQWIIPENVPAWYTLLQGSMQSLHEEPLYYEEFSRQGDSEEDLPQIRIVELPEPLKEVLPQQSISKLGLRIVGSPEDRSGAILRYFGIQSETNNNKDSLSKQLIIELVRKLKKPVVQVLVNATPISLFGRSNIFGTFKELCVVIVPDLDEGPAIFVTNDTMSEFIPSEYIQGQIFKSIENLRLTIKKPVLETVKEQGPVQGPVQAPVQAPVQTPVQASRLRILPIASQITEQGEISSPSSLSPKPVPGLVPVPEPTIVSRLLSMVTNSSQQPPEVAPAEPLPERVITRSYKIKPPSTLPQTSVPK